MAPLGSPLGRVVVGALYAGLLSATSACVEKVRTQFLSLRQNSHQTFDSTLIFDCLRTIHGAIWSGVANFPGPQQILGHLADWIVRARGDRGRWAPERKAPTLGRATELRGIAKQYGIARLASFIIGGCIASLEARSRVLGFTNWVRGEDTTAIFKRSAHDVLLEAIMLVIPRTPDSLRTSSSASRGRACLSGNNC